MALSSLPSAVSGMSYNANNEQTNFNGVVPNYDANGNLTADGANTYTWDARSHLASISGPVSASFIYDPFGRRTATTINGNTTQFQYDGTALVQEIAGSAGNLLTDMGFSRVDLSGNMTFLRNALGSIIALVDDNGSIQTEYSYEPFGAVTISGAASTNPYQYGSHQNDGTGLYYYSARYYSPTMGRFISEDPAGMEGGLNLYVYASDSPATLQDPTGLSPESGSGECQPCQAILRYHKVNQKYPFNHTFWETDAGPGTADVRVDSGEPWPRYEALIVAHLAFLNHYTNYPEDSIFNAPSWTSPKTVEVCQQVDLLRATADLWPNYTYFYNLFSGPNSNSFAHFLRNSAGFNNATPPRDAPGWDYPLF